jgi:hypothetical protein
MAVESVHEKPRVVETDPKSIVERKPEDVLAVQNDVIKARARRELVQEQKLTEQIMSPPQAPEPPFKVSGGINLGQIDIQEQQRQAREDAKREREAAEAKIDALSKERDDARAALQAASLEHLRDGLVTQIESLKGAIASGQKRDFFSELEGIENAATKLGFSRTDGASADFNGQLALKRLEQEMKREDRRFALEMKKDERLWQLELKKLEQNAKESEARLAQEQQKYAMLAGIPEQLGGAIAKGLIARGGEPGGMAAQPPPPQSREAASVVEAEEGESGTVPCAKCHTEVGIGPTTMSTACANCGKPVSVKRVKAVT